MFTKNNRHMEDGKREKKRRKILLPGE